MNTPINKSIFNDTGCIRRELLIGYKKETLNPVEKHEVEEHLVDCALCNDALEGLALVSGTAVLDSLQDEVSRMVQPHAAPALRPWLAAATIAGVMALSYFTWLQFKNVKEERLAENIQTETPEIKLDQHMIQPVEASHDSAPAATAVTLESNLSQKSVSSKNKIASTTMANDEIIKTQEGTTESVADAVHESNINTEASVKQIAVPPASKDVITYSLPSNYNVNQNITYVDNVKVIDYTEYDKDNIQQADQIRNTAPKYENQKKSKEAEMAEEKSGLAVKRKVDYIDMVSDPIILFNNGRYESANSRFDELLKINSNDQNAAFYKGLSLYNLNRYKPAIQLLEPISNDSLSPFNEEAKYYTAKSYINKGEKKKGKDMLEEIVNQNGFYSKQAGEDLKDIK